MKAPSNTCSVKSIFYSFLVLNIALIGVWSLLRVGRQAVPSGTLLIRQSALTRNYDYKRLFSFLSVDFSSRFSSGHLKEVLSRGNNHYSIVVGNDPKLYNVTSVNKNWFFFRMTNKAATQSLSLEVQNLRPNWSMWKNGMALAYRSNLKTKRRWRMFRAPTRLELSSKALRLGFKYRLERNEWAEFAFTYPYTRGRLKQFLDRLQQKAEKLSNFYFSRETLTLSSLNYTTDMLRLSATNNITRFSFPLRTNSTDSRVFSKGKCNIVLSARVHPAETGASFMLEGLLDYLVDNAQREDVRLLFERCALTVVPMLNPDGVELGFTRTDLHGHNLNAIYQEADVTTPTIYALRKVMRYLDTRSSVRLFLDFHTHMTKRGFFLFGNPLRRANHSQVLEFPFLLKQVEPQFSLESCGFGSSKYGYTSRKEVASKTLVQNVYTIETNYWGPSMDIDYLKKNRLIRGNTRVIKNYENFYTKRDLKNFGKSTAQAILLMVARKAGESNAKLSKRITAYFEKSLKIKNFH